MILKASDITNKWTFVLVTLKQSGIKRMTDCNVQDNFNSNGDLQRATAISFQVTAVVTMLLNLLLLLALVKTKQTRANTSSYLITLLSVADSLNGAMTILSLTLYQFLDNISSKCGLKKFSNVCSGSLSYLSFSIIVIIAADRYVKMNPNIERPSRFAKMFKPPKLYILLAVVTVFSLLYAASFALMSHHPSFLAIYTLTCAIFISIVIFSVTFFYLRGYLRIKKFAENNPVYANQDGTVARPEYVKRLHKTVVLLLGSLYISCVPMLLYTCLFSVSTLGSFTHCLVQIQNFFIIAIPVLSSTRVFGPIIILCCNSKARSWVSKHFKAVTCHVFKDGDITVPEQ